jgi:hypothetical protein
MDTLIRQRRPDQFRRTAAHRVIQLLLISKVFDKNFDQVSLILG